MAYGLTVKNSSDYIQIDQDYANCTLIASGTVSITESAVSGVNSALVSFASQSSPVVVCIGATGSAFVTLIARTSSSVVFVATAPISLPYRIYASTLNNPGITTGCGFIVKNASGGVVFNSNNTYMRVGQVTFSTVGYSTMPTISHSFGNAFVDITNVGAVKGYLIRSTNVPYTFAFGIQVGNGFYRYGHVIISSAPVTAGPGFYKYPNGVQQAMVLSA